MEESDSTDSHRTPGEQWSQAGSTSLKRTKLGLSFVYFGIGLVVLSAFGIVYFMFATEVRITIIKILQLGNLVGYMLLFIGPVICLSVPDESKGKGLLFAAALCLSTNLVYSGTELFDPGYLTESMITFLKLAGDVGLVLFILFMKKLAIYINHSNLISKVTLLLYLTVLILGGEWLFSVLEYFYFTSPFNPLISLTGIMFVLAMYTYVVGLLKEALTSSS